MIDELKQLLEELIIQGHTYDKFFETRLDLALRSQDIRYLIITGIMADICVNCTLLSAAPRDYRVTANTDGITTLWPTFSKPASTFGSASSLIFSIPMQYWPN